MSANDDLDGQRQRLDLLDQRISELVAERDRIAAEVIRAKGRPPYDAAREQEIAGEQQALWLPLLRRVRTSEGARLAGVVTRPPAFPGEEFVLIAGLCSLDGPLEEMLRGLHELGLHWARAAAWKSRSFPCSDQGAGMQGLRRLRAAADALGMQVVSEVVSELNVEAAAELIDVIQVGARNGQNFALLKLLGQLGKPVLLERGPACTVEEWLGAAAYLDGRVPLSLCERGVRGFDPCLRNSLDLPGALLARRLAGFQTLIDPSQATGLAGLVLPMLHAARAAGLDGGLVEVHAPPCEGTSDARQALTLAELARGLTGLGVAQREPLGAEAALPA